MVDLPADLIAFADIVTEEGILRQYFSAFHDQWPILHRPTYDGERIPQELQCSVGLVGLLLRGDVSFRPIAIRLHQFLSRKLFDRIVEVCFTSQIFGP